MSVVTLVSGGLDSSLISVLLREAGIVQWPLFIDYGQRAVDQEWVAVTRVHERFGLPKPARMSLSGYGELISSGLTWPSLRVDEDAFLPGRNLLFLLAAAGYSCRRSAGAVVIGLLDERQRLFPDQSASFVRQAEDLIAMALGRRIRVLAPLITTAKADVLRLAQSRGIDGTYSCHAGGHSPCGTCVSCRELLNAEAGG